MCQRLHRNATMTTNSSTRSSEQTSFYFVYSLRDICNAWLVWLVVSRAQNTPWCSVM